MKLDKEADQDLMNWARSVNDAWLGGNVLFSLLPTSNGYVADTVAFDDPEPAKIPVDEIAAKITEELVVKIGGLNQKVLVHWYPRLMMLRREGESINQREALKLLSKHMHTSVQRAQWMLEYSVNLYARKGVVIAV